MILCDHAQAAEVKLYINGGGPAVNTVGTPISIALLIGVPWDQANRQHRWTLSLVTADGHPVSVATPVGAESGGRVALRSGPVARNSCRDRVAVAAAGRHQLRPLPLAPASQFEWRLEIDAKSEDHWRLPFYTSAVAGVRPPIDPR